jgi:hypothetical protein
VFPLGRLSFRHGGSPSIIADAGVLRDFDSDFMPTQSVGGMLQSSVFTPDKPCYAER